MDLSSSESPMALSISRDSSGNLDTTDHATIRWPVEFGIYFNNPVQQASLRCSFESTITNKSVLVFHLNPAKHLGLIIRKDIHSLKPDIESSISMVDGKDMNGIAFIGKTIAFYALTQ